MLSHPSFFRHATVKCSSYPPFLPTGKSKSVVAAPMRGLRPAPAPGQRAGPPRRRRPARQSLRSRCARRRAPTPPPSPLPARTRRRGRRRQYNTRYSTWNVLPLVPGSIYLGGPIAARGAAWAFSAPPTRSTKLSGLRPRGRAGGGGGGGGGEGREEGRGVARAPTIAHGAHGAPPSGLPSVPVAVCGREGVSCQRGPEGRLAHWCAVHRPNHGTKIIFIAADQK
eukprot:gene22888-biopygen7242